MTLMSIVEGQHGLDSAHQVIHVDRGVFEQVNVVGSTYAIADRPQFDPYVHSKNRPLRYRVPAASRPVAWQSWSGAAGVCVSRPSPRSVQSIRVLMAEALFGR